VAEDYLKRVERLRLRLKRAARHDLVDSTAIKPLASSTNTFKRVAKNIGTEHQVRSTIEFKIEVEKVAVSFLEGASRSKDPQRAEAAKALLAEHKPLLSALKQRKKLLDSSEGIIMSNETGKEATIKRTKGGKLKRVRPSVQFETLLTDVHAEALRLELEQIQDMRRKGKISNAAARDLRQDVYIVQMGLSDL